MKINWTVCGAALLVLTLAVLPRVEAGEVLNSVKARGQLRCGVSEGILGFSEIDADEHWHGLNVDFCRAAAAVVLGDADKVEFVPLSTSSRFPALQTRRIDLLLSNTT
ncbi:MAG TPA: transporter substrate-binding domain-containing protein, partial [Candidatus Paceibacterota bacterium]|nr:transporter substrate-binding domain-containing protein [Candidatus Paceibacterota bacterium]